MSHLQDYIGRIERDELPELRIALVQLEDDQRWGTRKDVQPMPPAVSYGHIERLRRAIRGYESLLTGLRENQMA